jgi:hypothetical protein
MTDVAERPALEKAAPKRRRKPLVGGLVRRFPDARTVKARAYRDLFNTVVEQYQPTSKLGFWLAGLTADLMNDYQVLRASKKKATRAQRRKLIGLLYGALRETRNASGHAHDDLAAELAKLTEPS